ncbi:hypothetical protein ACOME3_003291 [Neoechinorhynchus agilis]
MVAGFLDAITKIKKLKCNCDDDQFDKICRRYTVLLLVLFTVIISTKQYVGDPIACWTPAQFTGAHVEYANYICWVSNSYNLVHCGHNGNELSLDASSHQSRNIVPYYQWVPFILPCMALLFYLPSVAWHNFLQRKGFDLSLIARSVDNFDELDFDVKTEAIDHAAIYIDNALYAHHQNNQRVRFLALDPTQSLKFVIGESYATLGYDLLKNIIDGEEWNIHKRFPRVTLCDFIVRNLADNNHKHTVQCVLPVNMFNEKIFIIIWFWYSVVLVLTIVSILIWLWCICFPWSRRRFIHSHLIISDYGSDIKRGSISRFIDDALKTDGIFLLRIMSKNTSKIGLCELVTALWNLHERECIENKLISP